MASLFGEFQSPQMDITKSRGFVLQGLDDMLKKGMGKAGSQYSRMGWGSGIHAPSVESAIRKPWIEQASETGRKALTDLYFKDEQMKLAREKWNEQYDVLEDQRGAQRKKEAGGKYLCTSLYKQGLLSFSHIKNDLKFLKKHVSPKTHAEYRAWAEPLSKVMDRNKLLTFIVYPFVKVWSGYMNAVVKKQQIPVSGYLVHNLGLLIGKVYRSVKRVNAIA